METRTDDIDTIPNTARRTSFTKRLVVYVGAALAIALAALAVSIWVLAFGWLNYTSRLALETEAQSVSESILDAGALNADLYTWTEAHHMYVERRIDPHFLQVFDSSGRMLRESYNVTLFPPGAYPDSVLAAGPIDDSYLRRVPTIEIDEQTLQYHTHPITTRAQPPIGYVQVARYDPGNMTALGRLAAALFVGYLVSLSALLAVVWGISSRVVRPLRKITEATRGISSADLSVRVPTPENADRETCQLAGALNESLGRLEGSFEDMRRFTANAAHELQTPLAVLLGHVDVALRRQRTPEDYVETLAVLRKEIDGLTRLTRGLLQLARMDAQPEVNLETIDIGKLVEQVAEKVRAASGHRIDVTQETVGDTIEGQEDLLREAVGNVIENAAKFSPDGKVTVEVGGDEVYGVVTVRDTGIGIAEHDLPHVTKRFFRAATPDRDRFDGSGLGLSLVDRIMTWHGGRLDITSKIGEGTQVVMAFRRRPVRFH